MNKVNKYKLSLLGITAMAALLVTCGGSAPKNGGSDENGSRIHVEMQDLSISLDSSKIEAGQTTFAIQNKGSASHDFYVQGNGVEQKTPIIAPGESSTLSVYMEPGTYTYFCTIPGHKDSGMVGTFEVVSP